MSDSGVDVSDLHVAMEDLEIPLDLPGEAQIATGGVEHSSGVVEDNAIHWSETPTVLSAVLSIPGLMGQPAEALAVELTENTMTVTAFAMPIWSCVLRGAIDAELSSPRSRFQAGAP
eukprot:CAMPEP_0195639768 /NCGR_PEP_ID=MMETSP0815-20121206/25782_1 /TAXON_ID=97485 /ORGANISM="Prymnesium parvum, Strain Texoma1" /LENGTH=116 /DNA_ID=CAMNT_0040782373 /DNA_START=43 /DNA_END=389 /DNA_ORIENTATION=-